MLLPSKAALPLGLIALAAAPVAPSQEPAGNVMDYASLTAPSVGDYALRVLTPTVLELRQLNTKAPDPALVPSWNLVDSSGQFTAAGERRVHGDRGRLRPSPSPPSASGAASPTRPSTRTTYGSTTPSTCSSPPRSPTGRRSSSRTRTGRSVRPAIFTFQVVTNPLRYSPAIHVNQEGYVPSFSKVATVGYYLGDMGEMPVPANRASTSST